MLRTVSLRCCTMVLVWILFYHIPFAYSALSVSDPIVVAYQRKCGERPLHTHLLPDVVFHVHIVHVILTHKNRLWRLLVSCALFCCWTIWRKTIGDIFVQIWLQLQELRCHLKRCRQLTLQVKQISTAFMISMSVEGYTCARIDFSLAVDFSTHARPS